MTMGGIEAANKEAEQHHYMAKTAVQQESYMQETTDALSNLEIATASDRSVVAQLTEKNENVLDQIVTLRKAFEKMINNINNAQNRGRGQKPKGTQEYFWTHSGRILK